MKRFGYDLPTWEKGRAEITEILKRQAKLPRTISYSDLCQKCKVLQLEPDSPALAEILGEISTAEDKAGRGMLSVLVVHKDRNKSEMPGKGFFKLAKELGKDTSDDVALWAQELAKVTTYWKNAS